MYRERNRQTDRSTERKTARVREKERGEIDGTGEHGDAAIYQLYLTRNDREKLKEIRMYFVWYS